MEEFLIGSIKHMLPYYLVALVVGELLLFLREKRGLRLEIIIASTICLALTILGQFQTNSTWAAENRPVLLAVVNLLSVVLPLFVFVIANQFLVKIQKATLKHLGLLAAVVITVFIWPLWALYVTCASGLDCL